MGDEIGFTRGLVKREDVEALQRDMKDAIKGMDIMRYLETREPIFMKEASEFAANELMAFDGLVGHDIMAFLSFTIKRAVVQGFLIHKRANDRFWADIDQDSRF